MIILLTLLYSVLSSAGLLDMLFNYGADTDAGPWKPFNKSMLAKGRVSLAMTRTEVPKQKNYIITYNEKCPSEGYYFKKDSPYGKPEVCYLCFCKQDETAICWPRDNMKCDKEHYQRQEASKRPKRSPGIADIFFRDSTREALNHQTPEECKPHEGSYSIGCPPADWCVGCTVCDCDANGRWDCHLLSFCTEDDKKRQLKARGKIYVRGKKDSAKDARFEKNSRRQMAVKEIAKQMNNPSKKKTTAAVKVKASQTRKPPTRRRSNLDQFLDLHRQKLQLERQQQLDRQQETQKPPANTKPVKETMKRIPKTDKNVKIENKEKKKLVRKESRKMRQGKVGNMKKNNTAPKQNLQKKRAILRKPHPSPIPKTEPTLKQMKKNQQVQRASRRMIKQNKQIQPKQVHKKQGDRNQIKNKPSSTRKPQKHRSSEEILYDTETTTQTTKHLLTASDLRKLQEEIQNNYQKKIMSAVQKMIEEHMSKSKKVKRSAPVMKKVVVKKSVQEEFYKRPLTHKIPILAVPVNVKKTKINVERSNPVKLHRHKRDVLDQITEHTDTKSHHNGEIASQSLQVATNMTTSKPTFTTQTMYNYYKYYTDNVINTLSIADDAAFKNSTAKRSIDTQIEVLPKLSVLGLVDKENKTLIVEQQVFDNKDQNIVDNKGLLSNATESVGLKNLIETTVVVSNKTNKENISDFIKLLSSSTSAADTTSLKNDATHAFLENATVIEQILPISVMPKFVKKDSLNATGIFETVPNIPTDIITSISIRPNVSEDKTTDNTKKYLWSLTTQSTTPQKVSLNISIVNTSTTSVSKVSTSYEVSTDNVQRLTPHTSAKPEKETHKTNPQFHRLSTYAPERTSPLSESSFLYNVRDYLQVNHDISKFKKKKKYYRTKKPRLNGTRKETMDIAKSKDKQVMIWLKNGDSDSSKENSFAVNNANHSNTDLKHNKTKDIIVYDTPKDKSDVKINHVDKISLASEIAKTMKPTLNNSHFSTIQNKKKLNSHDIKMRISNKKHKIKKVISTLYNKNIKNSRKFFPEAAVNVSSNDDLRHFFRKLINGFDLKKRGKKRSKTNRYKILKYLQNFFQKLFASGKHKKNKNSTVPDFNKQNVIETLCATFGPCNINVKNKLKLQSQIEHLNFETYNMLRSIKILKGLLRLIDVAKHDRNINGYKYKTEKSKFKSDIQKLHAILKGTYVDDEHLDKLTETQKTQIEYIKNCTQTFIQSATKFTLVLNDIINTISIPAQKNKAKERNPFNLIPQVESITTNITITTMSSEPTEGLKKLKDLVSKYSIIQNAFMRKIHKMLASLKDPQPDLMRERAKGLIKNKTEEIQVYTKNIIQNLRKLKNLAQMLNGNTRRKRNVRDDESIEYLLMLMEYLLKQNHPTEPTPVKDGIDLLIDAIKNSPDIKTTSKQPSYGEDTNKSIGIIRASNFYNITGTTTIIDSFEANFSREDSGSDYNKISKEDNYTSALDESKYHPFDHSLEDNSADDDKITYRPALLPQRLELPPPTSTTLAIEDITEKRIYTEPILYTKVYMATFPSTTDITTLELNTSTETATETTETTEPKEPPMENRIIITSNETKDAKLESFSGEIEDEIITESPKRNTTPISLEMERKTEKLEFKSTEIEDDSASISKSKIDWLDESYEEEVKAEINRTATTVGPVKTTSSPNFKVSKAKLKSRPIGDVSGFSKEILREGFQGLNNTSSEEILYKKDLGLNSLDYGREKSDVDGSDSKDSGSDDKYSGEGFSSYFN